MHPGVGGLQHPHPHKVKRVLIFLENQIKSAILTLAIVLTGCSITGQDIKLHPAGDTLYILTRSTGVSRGLCSRLGGDIAKLGVRSAENGGRNMRLDQVKGCHAIRHIIVCPESDQACLTHEEKHKLEGDFH